MAVAVAARDDANAAPGTTLTIDFGATQPTGRVLLFFLARSAADVSGTITPPSGLTEIGTELTDPTNNVTIRAYYKVTGGSEPATYVFSWPNSHWVGVEAVSLTGAYTANPMQATATAVNDFSTTHSTAAISIPGADGMLFQAASQQSGQPPTSIPSGYSEQFTSARWPVWFERVPAAGSLAAQTYTITGNAGSATRAVFIGATAGAVAPSNTVAPTLSNTATAIGAVLTGALGTWINTPTLYSYEFRYAMDPGEQAAGATPTALGVNWKTIAGTAGTTTNGAFAPTYTLVAGDQSKNIFLHVTASNAAGEASADSPARNYRATKIPFRSTGNPFTTTIPGGTPTNALLTTNLQSELTGWYAGSRKWWLQGGEYGAAYSTHLFVVNSSMPRTPFTLIGRQSGWPAGNISTPKAPATQNGDAVSHMAWTFGVKNGGIPTPPGGIWIAPPISNPVISKYGDNHAVIYCEDTFEMWEIWAGGQIDSNTSESWGNIPVHSDYTMGSYVFGWGGYVRDVRQFPGHWIDKNDADGNKEFAIWGAMATSLAYFQISMMARELSIDGTLGHALGVITPGSGDAWVWPAQRNDVGSGGILPQGMRWQLDPSIDVDALATLGNANSDAFRNILLKTAQQYGFYTCDSTGNDIILRMEALGGEWPSIPNAYNTGTVSFDTLMRSVPTSAWSVISPSFRPAGHTLNPKTEAFTDQFATLDGTKWQAVGASIDVLGRLNLAVATGGSMMVAQEGYVRSLVGSTSMIELVQPAGTQCVFYVEPANEGYNTFGAAFNITAGNLRAEHYDIWGTKIGTDVVVAYNATNHKWLRFRATSAFAVVWEVSPGGAGAPTGWTWTTLRTDTPTWDLEQVRQSLWVQGTSGTAIFDNLNVAAATDTTPPATPLGLTATPAPGQIVLNWNDNTDPDLHPTAPYLVERAPAAGGPWTQIATRTVSAYTDTNVTGGVVYYYRVKAQDNAP